jgi:hypothetical protein
MTIRDAWDLYRAKQLPADPPDGELAAAWRAFHTGAATVFAAFMATIGQDAETAFATYDALQAEMNGFASAIVSGVVVLDEAGHVLEPLEPDEDPTCH